MSSVVILTIVESRRTDGSGVPLANYVGYYGPVGSQVVEIVNVDGWDLFYQIAPGGGFGERCGVLRAVPGGLAIGAPTAEFLRRRFDASFRDVALTGDSNGLMFAGERYTVARRSIEPDIDSMWNLDGKSSRLEPCAPSPLQHLQLIWLTILGVR